jgi:YegS/Rv2252/BmrU family lipid kinase
VGHASELARQAAAAGYQTVVALGGDGTVNEVINGLLAEGGADPQVTLGIIPGEKGNDLARTLGIPFDYAEACRRLIKGKRVSIDLGKITYTHGDGEAQRYFINVAGLGFDSEVVRRITPRLRALSSPTIRYLSSLLITLATYENRDVRIMIDGEELRQRAFSVVICIGRYFGGGMQIAPGAIPDDGLFDVIVIGDLTKREILANLPRVYKGTHLSHPKVGLYRARKIRVETQERTLLQADGELLGETPTAFEIIPQAIRVLI